MISTTAAFTLRVSGIESLWRGIWLIPIFAITAYVAPLFFPSTAYVLIQDNLDGIYVRYKLLAESALIFAPNSAVLESYLGGLPRSTLPSEFDLLLWLFVWFGAFPAYVINQIIMRAVGFWGMFLLLRTHLRSSDRPLWQDMGVGLCFALLPFWPMGGLTVAALPFASFLLLSIRQGSARWWHWLTLLALPFYSRFHLSFCFLLLIAGGFVLVDVCYRRRRSGLRLFTGITVMTLCFLLVEYRLLQSLVFGAGLPSHRSEFRSSVTLIGAAARSFINFYSGHEHAASLQFPFILPASLLALGHSFQRRNFPRTFLALFGAALTISVFFGFAQHASVAAFISRVPGLGSFQFHRFHWLHPLLWTALFALALDILRSIPRYGMTLVASLLTLQVLYDYYASDAAREARTTGMTYSEFFAPTLFNKIKAQVCKPIESYRTAALGLHPSILAFNGFRTIDGYSASYPLQHKRTLRRLMATELERSPRFTRYFDDWGSRAYILVRELEECRFARPDCPAHMERLQLDGQVFTELGARYLFSSIPIADPSPSQLAFRGKFTSSDTPWKIYLYETTAPPHDCPPPHGIE